MNDWAELDRALGAMAKSGCTEVREDDAWLAELTALHCKLRHEGKNPLVHLWSDERNLTRRVLRIKEQSQNRIVLEVQRCGRAKPGRLASLRTDSPRSAAPITREQFRAWLRRTLAERFPDLTIDSLTAAADLEHSFSGVYVRGRMHEGSRAWAVLAAAPGESSAAIDGLRLFVPEGSSRFLRERVLGLSAASRVELFEFREADGRMQKIHTADAGNLASWLVSRGEIESACAEARHAIGRIHAPA
jgi:hypothetical protein